MICCRIFTPEGSSIEVNVDAFTFEAPDARRTISEGHMPIVVSVEDGMFQTRYHGERVRYDMGDGVMYYRKGVATFLVSSVSEGTVLSRYEEPSE